MRSTETKKYGGRSVRDDCAAFIAAWQLLLCIFFA